MTPPAKTSPRCANTPPLRKQQEGLMSQLMSDFPGQLRRLVVDPIMGLQGWPYSGTAGSAQRGGRPNSRANPWGLPINEGALSAAIGGSGRPSGEAGALASTMEELVLGVLQEGTPRPGPSASDAADGARAPAQPPQAAATAAAAPGADTPGQQRAQATAAAGGGAGAAAAPQIPTASVGEPTAPHSSHEPSQLPTPQPTGLGLAATDIMQALEAALAAATGAAGGGGAGGVGGGSGGVGGGVGGGSSVPPPQPPQDAPLPPVDAEMSDAAGGAGAQPMQQGVMCSVVYKCVCSTINAMLLLAPQSCLSPQPPFFKQIPSFFLRHRRCPCRPLCIHHSATQTRRTTTLPPTNHSHDRCCSTTH